MRSTFLALAATTASIVSASAEPHGENPGSPFGLGVAFPSPPLPSVTPAPGNDAFADAVKSIHSSLVAQISSVKSAASALASTSPEEASAISSAIYALETAGDHRLSHMINFGETHSGKSFQDVLDGFKADASSFASQIEAQAAAASNALHLAQSPKSPSPLEARAAAPSPKVYKHFDCGTTRNAATDEFLQTISQLEKQPYGAPTGGSAASQARVAVQKITVPVVFHIVNSVGSERSVTPKMISDQLTALNAGYNNIGVYFNLINTTNTTNTAWAQGLTSDVDLAMKTALRQGTYGTLNLYFQSDYGNGLLGLCTLPTNIGTSPPPSVYAVDGCNIASGSMPNGPILGYNQGKTAVHETGHWLGLLHTFEGYACTGTGDFIADTPAEAVSTDGCPISPWKNSCAGLRPGLDPIHNFMDYSTDACYTRFTAGQQTRIMTLWPMYRQGK